MFLGLRTIIYPAADLPAAKAWFAELLGHGPYFDEPYYVGFDVGGYELGLQPAETAGGSPVTYWGVPDADAGLKRLLDHGAEPHSEVAEVGGGIRVAVVRGVEGHLVGVIENPHFRPKG
ncbi:putative enzyme related to lactoylglutathione lyase [Murinocardiopsis flavida]|uniref:Putative enzyme related to lactoylglutathione lyase n=1 Tax=Murinocardiopsis flavida TaxID=645275 RepID=A0A2P8DIS4_9ACTN|nr:glyoxalase/bleomycin resistance/extradiol dioxygenase family protein [Murinocardiopsis flavida]PSK97114.1 putative enzyme related to lactoylglutathione lyase [Murinocardiopsis flavida]